MRSILLLLCLAGAAPAAGFSFSRQLPREGGASVPSGGLVSLRGLPEPAPWSLIPVAIAIFTARRRAARNLLVLLMLVGLAQGGQFPGPQPCVIYSD